jgi:hypothetical protein
MRLSALTAIAASHTALAGPVPQSSAGTAHLGQPTAFTELLHVAHGASYTLAGRKERRDDSERASATLTGKYLVPVYPHDGVAMDVNGESKDERTGAEEGVDCETDLAHGRLGESGKVSADDVVDCEDVVDDEKKDARTGLSVSGPKVQADAASNVISQDGIAWQGKQSGIGSWFQAK